MITAGPVMGERALTPRATVADVLGAAVWARTGDRARDAALVVLGAALIALTANVAFPVPGSPVPVTGQTFSVLLVSGALGARRGLSATALYLVLGLFIPVYAGQRSGPAVFGTVDAAGVQLGATGGYLIGFLAASVVVGKLVEMGWDRRAGTALVAMLVGNATIYAIGVPWLAVAAGLGPGEAVAKGLLPFVFGDALKLLAGAGLLPAGWWIATRRPSESADGR